MRYVTAVVVAVLLTVGRAGAMERMSGGEMAATLGRDCTPKPAAILEGKYCVDSESCWDTETMGDGTCDNAFIYRILNGQQGPVIFSWFMKNGAENCMVEGNSCYLDPWYVKVTQYTDDRHGHCEDGEAWQTCTYGNVVCATAQYYLDDNCNNLGGTINVYICGCDDFGPGGLAGLASLQLSP